jgi:uncharacterized low-complexity protein
LPTSAIAGLVRAGRWQRVSLGVYASSPGELTREARLWAAVLRAGPAAVLSHGTAAELDGLVDRPGTDKPGTGKPGTGKPGTGKHGTGKPGTGKHGTDKHGTGKPGTGKPGADIHVTVPLDQHRVPIPGVVLHRCGRIGQIRHPSLMPPRTMIEETVLDLTQAATTFDDAFSWVALACQRGLTTPTLLRIRMDLRKKLRWREQISQTLPDVSGGVHSTLENRYAKDVERAHGLPRADRQARDSQHGRTIYRDVLYRAYGVVVELDGQLSHSAETRWRDIRRDNTAAAGGFITLRYGWADVTGRPCEVAGQVAAALRGRGWAGGPRCCGSSCPAGRARR